MRIDRWWWTAGALTALKVWLVSGQALFAIGPDSHDDHLFLTLADAVLKGEWLGRYHSLTLAKGPFYSLWIAAVALTGLPLKLAEQVAYAGACALVVRALGPLLRNRGAGLAVYALLLWNPMTFHAPVTGRILRQVIYVPLSLMVFAGLVALYARSGERARRLMPWAAVLGLVYAAFWLTREESLWLGPSIVLLGGAALVEACRRRGSEGFRAMLAAGGVALACAALPILSVCALNAHYYGWFGSVELRAREFEGAYGALLRVRDGPESAFVPVSRQARGRIYAVSPAFAELRPYLEGESGRSWAAYSNAVLREAGLPATLGVSATGDPEILGAWFLWALRNAMGLAGHHRDARSALAHYQRIALEVNAACDAGRLPAGPPRSGFLPAWRDGQTTALVRATAIFAAYFALFRGFDAHTPPSMGDERQLRLFRDLSRESLSPTLAAASTEAPRPALDLWREAALQRIGDALRWVLAGLVLAAHAVVLARAGQLLWRRQITYPFLLAVAAWGACAASLLINALIHITSFPTLEVNYLLPAYPLLLLFIVAAVWDVASSRSRRNG